MVDANLYKRLVDFLDGSIILAQLFEITVFYPRVSRPLFQYLTRWNSQGDTIIVEWVGVDHYVLDIVARP